MSKSTQIKAIVSIRDIFYANINVLFVFFLLSLRSDVRTDSLVDMVKKQQAKTNELAQIYHEQQQDD